MEKFVIILYICCSLWCVALSRKEKNYKEALQDISVLSYIVVMHMVIINMHLISLTILEVTMGIVVSQVVSINVILLCSNDELMNDKGYMIGLSMMSLQSTVGAIGDYVELIEVLKGDANLNKFLIIGITSSWLVLLIARLLINKRKREEKNKSQNR